MMSSCVLVVVDRTCISTVKQSHHNIVTDAPSSFVETGRSHIAFCTCWGYNPCHFFIGRENYVSLSVIIVHLISVYSYPYDEFKGFPRNNRHLTAPNSNRRLRFKKWQFPVFFIHSV